jgi:DNA-binding transcriptional LysR family regulator
MTKAPSPPRAPREKSRQYRRFDPSFTTTPIHSFQTAARLGSIRAAAEFLRVAPSAVSRQIAKLEAALGTNLFERLPRGIRLSSSGELFLYHARESTNQIDRARALISDMQGLKRGHVSIGTTESVAIGFLPPLLSAFWAKYPDITISVKTMRSHEAFNGVLQGEFDFAIGFDLPTGLPLRVLANARLRIGAWLPIRHPLTKAASVRMRDLAGERLLLPDDTVRLRALLNPLLLRNSLNVEARLISNSMSVLEVMASLGGGVLIETKVGLASALFTDQLSFRPLADSPTKSQNLQLCSRSSGLSPSALAVAKHLSVSIDRLSES